MSSSSLLHRVIVAHRCTSTHHHIAITALTLLEGEDAGKWRDLLLANHMELLDGAKAPDKVFKDFKNHVLHVSEGEWGGARDKALEWYANAVDHLKRKRWAKAAYALGVMSHYYADPIQPFHTGQTEEEGAVHRALEWSIAKSRHTIEAKIAETGYPKVPAGEGAGFVSDMVRAGADKSHPHYQTLIDHYNLDVGAKDPEAGLDQTLIDVISELVAYATAGLASIYQRAFDEAGVAPPKVSLSLLGYLSTLDIPLRWVTKKLADAEDRTTVQLMYDEWKATGKVVKALPDDDKAIRKLHARQVRRISVKELDALPAKPIGSKHVPLVAPEPQKEEVTRATPKAVEASKASKPEEAKPKPIAAPQPAPDESVEITSAENKPAARFKLKRKLKPEPVEGKAIETAIDAAIEAPKQDDVVSTKPERRKADVTPKPEAEPAVEAEAADIQIEDKQADDVAPPEWTQEDGLTLNAPVEEAPSIGRKTAARLRKVGIYTVGDLIDADVAEASAQLKVKFMSARTLSDWQDQTRLMLSMPSLRVHDAQILVGAGVRNVDDLANASARDLLDAAMDFLSSTDGARTVRGDYEPNAAEVDDWIGQARAVGE
ncbi:MAG: DUF4332 domain-containing protein [Pseudomonadota bacterium]